MALISWTSLTGARALAEQMLFWDESVTWIPGRGSLYSDEQAHEQATTHNCVLVDVAVRFRNGAVFRARICRRNPVGASLNCWQEPSAETGSPVTQSALSIAIINAAEWWSDRALASVFQDVPQPLRLVVQNQPLQACKSMDSYVERIVALVCAQSRVLCHASTRQSASVYDTNATWAAIQCPSSECTSTATRSQEAVRLFVIPFVNGMPVFSQCAQAHTALRGLCLAALREAPGFHPWTTNSPLACASSADDGSCGPLFWSLELGSTAPRPWDCSAWLLNINLASFDDAVIAVAAAVSKAWALFLGELFGTPSATLAVGLARKATEILQGAGSPSVPIELSSHTPMVSNTSMSPSAPGFEAALTFHLMHNVLDLNKPTQDESH